MVSAVFNNPIYKRSAIYAAVFMPRYDFRKSCRKLCLGTDSVSGGKNSLTRKSDGCGNFSSSLASSDLRKYGKPDCVSDDFSSDNFCGGVRGNSNSDSVPAYGYAYNHHIYRQFYPAHRAVGTAERLSTVILKNSVSLRNISRFSGNVSNVFSGEKVFTASNHSGNVSDKYDANHIYKHYSTKNTENFNLTEHFPNSSAPKTVNLLVSHCDNRQKHESGHSFANYYSNVFYENERAAENSGAGLNSRELALQNTEQFCTTGKNTREVPIREFPVREGSVREIPVFALSENSASKLSDFIDNNQFFGGLAGLW